MNYVLLVSHGQLAEGLHQALTMFVGEKDEIKSIGLSQGEDVTSLAKRIDKMIETFNQEDSFIILGDLIGGSPLTTMVNCMQKKQLLSNCSVLGGMNLAMALNAVLMKDDVEQAKTMALHEAKQAIKEWVFDNSEEEEI